MIVISEDGAGNAATLTYCKQYAASHDADLSKTFIDKVGDISWGATFAVMDNYASGGMGVPWSGLLGGRSMAYIMNDYAGDGSLDFNIQQLLNEPL